MCGIAGFVDSSLSTTEIADFAVRMARQISSRGPDGFGRWIDSSCGIALAHRRLAVQDLSPAGKQPMVSTSGRYILVFNGEIYNHSDLRKKLHASFGDLEWRGHSDTETLLAAFEFWGVSETIERCVGMFAFALWDRRERVLILGRDRIGEKPLYYGWQGESFLFGSELKALKAHQSFRGEINRAALCLFVRFNYIPAPYSIYKGIYKLQPGHILRLPLGQSEPIIEAYWSFPGVVKTGFDFPSVKKTDDVLNELENLLKSAVRMQMAADVPLGAFLSGGIDSSLVAALMQSQSDAPIKTFSIGFNKEQYNEAVNAKAVSDYLGTDHTEHYVTPEDALNVIARLPTLYCEPFGDSSQIATFLVSQLATDSVTVSLSGDGGDELFGGYNRYTLVEKLWKLLQPVPVPVRAVAASCIISFSPDTWNAVIKPVHALVPKSLRQINIGEKLHKGANVINAEGVNDLYMSLLTHWDPKEVVIDCHEPGSIFSDASLSFGYLDDVQRMMALDTLSYLPDDILVKVDRAAMGVSLETRVPLLDHRIVEFAWRIPKSMKLRGGVGKWILRQILYRYIPKELVERPKMGFSVPIDDWLRGPLRDWADALLNEERLQHEGFFNPAPIRLKWEEHLSGRRNWKEPLWGILMFQSWLEAQNTSIGIR